MLKIINLERVNTMIGGLGYGHDRAIVIETSRTVKHIITGELQPERVYTGDLDGAIAYVAKANG
jgi:hypothetical protein